MVFPSYLLQLGEILITLQIGNDSVLIDTGATLLVLNLTGTKQPVPASSKTVQIVGVSNNNPSKPSISAYPLL